MSGKLMSEKHMSEKLSVIVETKATSTLPFEVMHKQLSDAGLQITWNVFSDRNYFGGSLSLENAEAIRRLPFVQLLREECVGRAQRLASKYVNA